MSDPLIQEGLDGLRHYVGRLHLPLMRVLGVVEDTPARLVVGAESTLRQLRYPGCGFKCHRVHDRHGKGVRDLGVSGQRTTLLWSRQRMGCDSCVSRILEDHCAFEGGLTARLARALVADARVMTLRAAARRRGVGWHRINDLVRLGRDRRRAPPVPALPKALGR